MSRVVGTFFDPTVTELVGLEDSDEHSFEAGGRVNAVNDHGTAVGRSVPLRHHALKWDFGSVTDLHALSGEFENEFTEGDRVRRSIVFSSDAYSINDSGAVVGEVSSEEQVFVRLLGVTVRSVRTTVSTAVLDMVKIFLGAAHDINAAGQVAGYSYEGTASSGLLRRHVFQRDRFAVRWENGQITRLFARSSGQHESQATGINDHGHVVGYGGEPEMPGAWLWRNGQFTSLGIPLFRPRAINNAGQVVGRRQVAVQFLAMLWAEASADVVLPLLPGHVASEAFDVNNAGEAVGYSEPDWKIQRRAVMWSRGVAHDLTAMLPANSGWVLYMATGISDKGHIVGIGSFDGKRRGFLLTWPQLVIEPVP